MGTQKNIVQMTKKMASDDQGKMTILYVSNILVTWLSEYINVLLSTISHDQREAQMTKEKGPKSSDDQMTKGRTPANKKTPFHLFNSRGNVVPLILGRSVTHMGKTREIS